MMSKVLFRMPLNSKITFVLTECTINNRALITYTVVSLYLVGTVIHISWSVIHSSVKVKLD